ncbi:MAG: hypothetical protein R3Y60_03515 [bacterium]
MTLKKFVLLLILMIVSLVGIQYSLNIQSYLSYLLIIPGLIVGFVFTIIFHELGHLVFGLYSGYKFTSFKVLCIKIYKKDKIRICYEPGFLSVPGQCLMKPTNRKYFTYNLGGLIFTYFLSIILLLILYRSGNDYLIQFLFGVFTVNTFLGVMNSIYSEDGVNDICNIVRCKRNKDYLEGVLYQLDVISNVSIEQKFKSKYKPKDDVGNVVSNVSIHRIKYLKAYSEKNVEKMEYHYMYLRRNYSRINMMILKFPILILLLNHEFIIKKDVIAVGKRVSRITKKEYATLKKFKDEYNIILFYKNNIKGKIDVDEDFFDSFIVSNPIDLFEKLNNRTFITMKSIYMAYVRNGYVLN